MAREKGDDDKRRRGRGKSEEGPSDEELDWLADLRGGRDSRAPDPFGEPASRSGGPSSEPPGRTGKSSSEGPRGRRTVREEPPTGGITRGGAPGAPAGPPPGPGQAARPARRTPPLPPVSPAGPAPLPPTPAGPPPTPAGPPLAAAGPPLPPPAKAAPASKWSLMRRTPATPPAAPPPPPAKAAPPPPTPPARGAGPRPMIDWSDLTGELPAAAGPPSGPAGPPLAPTRPSSPPPPEPPRRPTEPRTGGLRPGVPPAGPPGPGFGGPTATGPLPGPGLGGPADAMVTTGMIRRAELRKHMRIQQQLKSVTLTLVVLLLLAAYPVYLFAQALAKDPVFSGLDGLDLPQWAAYDHADRAEGSRWCIDNCRSRTRSWLSERGPEETQTAYVAALNDDGWRTYVGACQQSADESVITCWKKDEYVMVMHVYPPLCEAPPPRDPVPGATTPSATESANPEPTAGDPVCPQAQVTMYISNAIDYQPQA